MEDLRDNKYSDDHRNGIYHSKPAVTSSMGISHFVLDFGTQEEDLDKWQRSWFDYDALVGDSKGTKVHHTSSLHLGQCQGLGGGTLAQAFSSPSFTNQPMEEMVPLVGGKNPPPTLTFRSGKGKGTNGHPLARNGEYKGTNGKGSRAGQTNSEQLPNHQGGCRDCENAPAG